jgi:GYF domain 2
MAFEVECGKCGARFTLPQDLYDRKVKGRVVTVRCKKCRADITVDGTHVAPHRDGPVEETPTVPLSHTTLTVGGLWVVSYADDDDRELTVSQIRAALERGEIDGETLVWNSGMDEWHSLKDVPELAALSTKLAAEVTGGFLGTGASVKAQVREPALRRSSRPPPPPSAEENELLGDDEIGPFRSESAGTFFVGDESAETKAETKAKVVVDDAKTEPMPPVRAVREPRSEIESRPPPKPGKRLPDAPAKVKPEWMSDLPPPPADEDEEEAPISGTPDLRALTATLKPDAETDDPNTSGDASEDIFKVGAAGGIAAQIPTIDLSALPEAPPSSDRKRRRNDEEEAPSSPRAASDAKKKAAGAKSSAKAESPAREEPAGTSSLTWLVIGALALLAIWYVFLRPKTNQSPAEPTPPVVTNEPAVTPTAPSSEVPETPTASATESANSAPSAAPSARPLERETVEREPREPKEKEPKEKEPKPKETAAPEETGSEVAMAPPFDANAASAAVASAAAQATSCRQEGDPTGTTTVIITFAPSGRVTTATVNGPPFAGTKTGGCIAATMRRARVPAFSGDAKTVSKSVTIN